MTTLTNAKMSSLKDKLNEEVKELEKPVEVKIETTKGESAKVAKNKNK